MKRYLLILALISVSLVVVVGCSNFDHISSADGQQNNAAGNASSRPDEATDWEPTNFQTVNNIDGITMTVKEGAASATGLTVTFENNYGGQCIYSESFWLQKKIDGKWYQVPVVFDGDYAFEDIGYSLDAGSSGEWTVNWEWLYGSLDSGEYRIVKDVLVSTDLGEYDTYYLAAEFILS